MTGDNIIRGTFKPIKPRTRQHTKQMMKEKTAQELQDYTSIMTREMGATVVANFLNAVRIMISGHTKADGTKILTTLISRLYNGELRMSLKDPDVMQVYIDVMEKAVHDMKVIKAKSEGTEIDGA